MKRVIIISMTKRTGIQSGILVLFFTFLLFGICFITGLLHGLNQQKECTSKNSINLLKAYEEKDEASIKQYFINWNEESKSLTKTEYTDEVEKTLYEIYRTVFHPYQLDPLLNYRMLDYVELDLIEVIKKAPYVITQNEIQYLYYVFPDEGIGDLFNFELNMRINRDDIRTLTDFYPKVDLEDDKVLHLTKEYEKELNSFLGTKEKPFGEDNIMSPAIPKEETLKRYQFLRNYIPILYGHWGGYWHFPTHPELGLVFLEPDLTYAAVQYRFGYNFGWIELRKTDGVWTMIRAEMNGME